MRRYIVTGFDVIHIITMTVIFIRLGPKMWGALQVHGIEHASQSGRNK